MTKIALLIPSTTRERPWTCIEETYLYNLTLKTFLLTRCRNLGYTYTIYIGYDDGDKILSQPSQQEKINKFEHAFPDVKFSFVCFKFVTKGHLTKMWNILFQQAFDDGCDYFFQCGDDINFRTSNWITSCVEVLTKHNGIGITGPINNNFRILTQCMVTRRHMEIFKFFFPEEIQNWCCDDWYNLVYQPHFFFPLSNHYCSNEGGNPRYIINNDDQFRDVNKFQKNVTELRLKTKHLAEQHKTLLKDYIAQV
tara:strand:- start:389 stop:1144 length:756 start_codon:yes stop_codon:yes gene_type:complete